MKSLNPISNPSLSWLFPNRSQMVLIGQIWENVWRFWGFWLKGGRLCLWAITNRGHHGSALTLQGQWKSLKEEGGNDILVWDISGCPFIDMELVEFIEDAKTIQIFGEWMGISPPKPSPVTCPEWNHMWPAGWVPLSSPGRWGLSTTIFQPINQPSWPIKKNNLSTNQSNFGWGRPSQAPATWQDTRIIIFATHDTPFDRSAASFVRRKKT